MNTIIYIMMCIVLGFFAVAALILLICEIISLFSGEIVDESDFPPFY